MPLFSGLVLALALCPAFGQAADFTLEVTPQPDGTIVLTRFASTGFARNSEKLQEKALADAAAYCEQRHLVLKVIRTEKYRPFVPATGFAYGRVVFLALEPNDPALRPPAPAAVEAVVTSPPRTVTDTLYSDLMKLEELKQRGILSDAEFQTLKQRLIDKTH